MKVVNWGWSNLHSRNRVDGQKSLPSKVISRDDIIIHQCEADDGIPVPTLLPVTGAGNQINFSHQLYCLLFGLLTTQMFPRIEDSKLPFELMLTFLDMMERSTWVEAQQSHKDHLTLRMKVKHHLMDWRISRTKLYKTFKCSSELIFDYRWGQVGWRP